MHAAFAHDRFEVIEGPEHARPVLAVVAGEASDQLGVDPRAATELRG